MGLAKLKDYITVEEYLAGEKVSTVKHEYINGVVYPMYNETGMAGTSDIHNQIAGRLYTRLFGILDGTDCSVFISDMKLQAEEETFYYPDVFVACDKTDKYFRREPILIVEVLSPSAERTDRQEKLSVYRKIPSLREYVIIAQDKMRIEFHFKQQDDLWTLEVFNESDVILELKSVDLSISLSEIYRSVNFIAQ